MHHLANPQQFRKRCEVAFQHHFAGKAAHHHLGFLAVAAALPVNPAQVAMRDFDVIGGDEQRVEFPIDLRGGDVKMRQLQNAPDHFEHEHAEGEVDSKIVVEFQAGGVKKRKLQVVSCKREVENWLLIASCGVGVSSRRLVAPS